MPSVDDVFNQLVAVNGKLDQINVNTTLLANVNAALNQGFNDTVNALNVLTQVNIEALKVQYHQTRQADTMICNLEQISRNTCEILTQATIRTGLQEGMREDIASLLHMAESVHPGAAVEMHRHDALQGELAKCCPPERPRPACSYEPCERPEPLKLPKLPKDPQGSDYKPEG